MQTEAVGPFYRHEITPENDLLAIPPFYSRSRLKDIDGLEWDVLYPLVSLDRYEGEYRLHLGQLLAFAGGVNQDETKTKRLTLFPLYFQQRSTNPTNNYTAFLPFYGHLNYRLFRDEIKFVALPFYLQSRKRGVTTDNYLYPIFHLREGPNLKGWQVWPLMGREEQKPLTVINRYDEPQTTPGHRKNFVLWPFYLDELMGIGTTNQVHRQVVLPLYSMERSPNRDSTTYGWPLGPTFTDDREQQFKEKAFPWPLVVFSRGEGKTINRVWPFFGTGHTKNQEREFYLWPIYRHGRLRSPPLSRERTQVFYFLYSDRIEINLDAQEYRRRTDLWPIFSHQRNHDGSERLQLLSLLEPILANNKSIERNYSSLWSIWREEKNVKTASHTKSFLWNLYRSEERPTEKKCSLLFGLFQYQSSGEGKKWRLFYLPVGGEKKQIQPAANK